MAIIKDVLKNDGNFVYPQTSADQIVKSNGERLEIDGVIKATDVYSASETVVGDFLGKPLYRKVIEVNITPHWNGTYFAAAAITPPIQNVDIVVKISGIGGSHNTSFAMSLDYEGTNWYLMYANIVPLNKLIVEYTKTTD